jgi:hypothetical protein
MYQQLMNDKNCCYLLCITVKGIKGDMQIMIKELCSCYFGILEKMKMMTLIRARFKGL